MLESMKNPVVLITGASRGLGAALALEWARRGAALMLTARGAEALKTVANEIAGCTDVFAEPVDVTDESAMRAFVETGLRTFGRVDVLVNNASTLAGSPMPKLENLGAAAFFELMEVNVRAPLSIAQIVLPQMRARGSGTIVNVTSDAAVNAYAGWGGYGTSKAALEHLSRILAEELTGTGVRVMVIDPGNMDTQMHRDAEPGEDLSSLPKPESVAPRFIDLVEREREPFSRHEAQHAAAGV
jgi:NAD(P)-dependent dehydrogenase (short-subunit alcohol dehydrogenase family)